MTLEAGLSKSREQANMSGLEPLVGQKRGPRPVLGGWVNVLWRCWQNHTVDRPVSIARCKGSAMKINHRWQLDSGQLIARPARR